MIHLRNILNWLFSSKNNNIDWRAVIVCAILAPTFWLLNSLNAEHSTDLAYRVVFKDENTQELNLPSANSLVQFKVSGTGWNILREQLKEKEKTVYYTVNRKTSSKYIFSNNLRKSLSEELIEGLKISEIRQDTFLVDFEQLITKKVPVMVNQRKVKLQENVRIVSPVSINPKYVLLTGTLKDISLIDSVLIQLPENNISRNYNKRFRISSLLSQKIESTPKEVTVSFQVDEFVTKTTQVPIQKLNFSEHRDFAMEQDETEVVFVCRAEEVDKINVADFLVVADFYKMSLDDTTVTLTLEQMPEGVREVKINNKIIKLKYRQP